MPSAPSQRDVLAEVMDQGRKAIVPHLAEMLKRNTIKEVDSSEERRRFWQRALTPEQEQELWKQEMLKAGTLDLATLPSEKVADMGLAVSQQVYPDRWDMAPQEGRTTQSQQAEWFWKHAMQGPPEGAQDGTNQAASAAVTGGAGPGPAGQEQDGALVSQDLGQPA